MTIKLKTHEGDVNEETRIQKFVYQMLAGRIFTAFYVGQFYVEHLKTYRDVLRIQVEEKDMIKSLYEVKKRISNFYRGEVWPAITGPNCNTTPTGDCIWVKLKKNLPLGEARWFCIENAAIDEEGELVIQVKDVRKAEASAKKSLGKTSDKNSKVNNEPIPTIFDSIKQSAMNFLNEIITWHNIKEISRFLFLLLMTIISVLLDSLQYLGEFSLRLFREFNNFVKVSTPIFLAILDLIKKSIGGFFILIAMMWGSSSRAPPRNRLDGAYENRRRIKY